MSIDRWGRAWRGVWLGVLLATAGGASAVPPEPLVLDGVAYDHRWSKSGQNEYTPPGQDDLARWDDMLTLITRPEVADGEALAALANGVLANYERAGVILRTDSRPATPDQPPNTWRWPSSAAGRWRRRRSRACCCTMAPD